MNTSKSIINHLLPFFNPLQQKRFEVITHSAQGTPAGDRFLRGALILRQPACPLAYYPARRWLRVLYPKRQEAPDRAYPVQHRGREVAGEQQARKQLVSLMDFVGCPALLGLFWGLKKTLWG